MNPCASIRADSTRPRAEGSPSSLGALARALLLLIGLIAGCGSPGPSTHERELAAELLRARNATRDGRWQEAASHWHEIFLRADENSLEACTETARALIELGDPKSAQNLAELGIRTFPEASELHVVQAKALAAQGFPRAAETAYERALRAEPGRSDVVLALASLRCDLGLFDSALTLLAPLLDSDDTHAAAFGLAARAQRALKRYPEAFASFERAFAIEAPGPERLVQAASMYAEEGVRKLDARAAARASLWLTRALAIDPQSTMGHVYLGMIAEDEQRDVEAAASYRRAVETDPACVQALTALAILQKRRGELEDSKAMAERALALEKDPEKRVVLEDLAHPKPAEPPLVEPIEGVPKSDG